MQLSRIAAALACQLEGDGNIEISRVIGIEEAGPGDLTFLSNPKYASKIKTTQASAIIASTEVAPLSIPVLRSQNPYLTFAKAIELFYESPISPAGIHPTAIISPTAKIGKCPSIGPYVVIDADSVIGDHAVIHPFVMISRGAIIGDFFTAYSHSVVREYCEIGHRVILQNGVVVGADGFGFAKKEDGVYYKIRQSGRVIIEDEVEIQANSTIDRAAIGETRIRKGAKIDNLVQVGHGSSVGENSLLCAQVGLAGSTHIGKNVILTGQVGVAGHCQIGDGVIATAQTGIPGDVESGKMISGYPAIDNKLWLKSSVIFMKLPEINKTLRDIEKRVARMEKSTEIEKSPYANSASDVDKTTL
jgi:UDP-3-O-[3-hydroxymyristoyl] glucosamine N-acyltransferase